MIAHSFLRIYHSSGAHLERASNLRGLVQGTTSVPQLQLRRGAGAVRRFRRRTLQRGPGGGVVAEGRRVSQHQAVEQVNFSDGWKKPAY